MVTKKSHILNEIRRTAQANAGVPLGWLRFTVETGIRVYDWKGKIWARWSDAVREAGFAPNEMTQAYDEEELLQKYAQLALELGRLPTVPDIRLSIHGGLQFPRWGTFKNRFGGKAQLVEKVLEYCQTRGEYVAVVRYCESYVRRSREEPDETERYKGDIGFIYLIKSGRFYKIGRSNAPGRRKYELAIQLPEKVRLVHKIPTDDPCGVEAYWHKRFEEKRKHGEWFELKPADVSAFKRWKIT